MSHTSKHKAILQDQTTSMWQLISRKEIWHPYMEKPLTFCLFYWLFVTFLPEKQHISPAAEPGGSGSWMQVIMWGDLEQDTLSLSPSFCCCSYCFWKLVLKTIWEVMRWLLLCIGVIKIKIDWLIDRYNSTQNSHKYSGSCYWAKMFVWGL